MGEYAKHDGEQIKIGTCEEMYYLRYDQREEVEPEKGNVDPAGDERHELRFRFPWPDEDGTLPGEFEKPFRNYGLHIDAPEDVNHYSTQFSSQRGMLVSLPCPYSKEGKESPYKIGFNGYSGGVRIVQQKPLRDGRLALICECGGCGSKWRIEDEEELKPILKALEDTAEYLDHLGKESNRFWRGEGREVKDNPKGDGENEREIARRILAGYAVPVA